MSDESTLQEVLHGIDRLLHRIEVGLAEKEITKRDFGSWRDLFYLVGESIHHLEGVQLFGPVITGIFGRDYLVQYSDSEAEEGVFVTDVRNKINPRSPTYLAKFKGCNLIYAEKLIWDRKTGRTDNNRYTMTVEYY